MPIKERNVMKKIFFISIFIFLFLISGLSAQVVCDNYKEQDSCFATAFTAGFVFKHDDCTFKEVYGRGIVNIITADGCYYFCKPWGIGAKVSYWRAHGCTMLLKQCSLLQEVPLTFYLRRIRDFQCGLQLYASLGGGVIWLKEKSYLGHVNFHKGVGEVEVGLNYPICHCLNVTGAFRYLFPRECQAGKKVDVGGFDLRAGIAFIY